MTSLRLLLLLAVVCLVKLDFSQAEQNSESRRTSKLQHLKEQFELFKRELDSILLETGVQPFDEDPIADLDSSSDIEKRCHECDDSKPEKRCPSGCGSKTKNKPKTIVDAEECSKRCPGCAECQQKQPPEARALPQSEVMKRFLSVLPEDDQKLIEHSRAKKMFIERLIRRSRYGPNQNDIEGEKRISEERANAILNIGMRSMPSEETSSMTAFKKSLDATDQNLLKKFNSKTRFIQGLLDKPAGHDKRDVDEPKPNARRQFDDPIVADFIKNLDDSQKALIQQHPSVAGNLKDAILAGTSDDSNIQGKRDFTPDQIQAILSKLGSEDKQLAQEHLSRIDNLEAAEKRPTGKLDEGVEQVVARLVNDVKAAKKRGFDLGRLLDAMKKRGLAASDVKAKTRN